MEGKLPLLSFLGLLNKIQKGGTGGHSQRNIVIGILGLQGFAVQIEGGTPLELDEPSFLPEGVQLPGHIGAVQLQVQSDGQGVGTAVFQGVCVNHFLCV